VVRRLQASLRLARAVLHGLHGVAIVLVRFPKLAVHERRQRIRWWSIGLLQHLGMELHVQGSFDPGPKLVVINHVSWLDIMAVHAVCPEARFVSKADVKAWPVIRHLVDAADTLYIERERRRDAMRVVHQMADALREGHTVAIFPEGTTGVGPELLPFHANLLQAAITSEVQVQPVVLRFADAHGPFSLAAAYVGDTTLAQSLWALARGERLQVHITVLPPQASVDTDRRALAATLRKQIDAVLAPARG
jgi:1-acyl-sn-glycerol-3-phosphate acyltransferase